LGKFSLSGIPPAPRGVPQIEVVFDIDVNGVLRVNAYDLASANKDKSSGITITNDKGRLSPEDIERMVAEAEKYAEADRMTQAKIEARNSLEAYVYNVKNQVGDANGLGGSISDEDKTAIVSIVESTISWLDRNPSAEKQEYDEKREEVEKVVHPITSKMYGKNAGTADDAQSGSGAGFKSGKKFGQDDDSYEHDDL
ncbi:hypothetical protein DI09_281p10, partial [Mitosporidium daphniae]